MRLCVEILKQVYHSAVDRNSIDLIIIRYKDIQYLPFLISIPYVLSFLSTRNTGNDKSKFGSIHVFSEYYIYL